MRRHSSACIAICLLAAVCASCDTPAPDARPGDLTGILPVDDHGLLQEWPPAGPHRLWVRDLGPGYSGIAVGEGRLFTMYRAGGKEVVVALDALTGATLWESAYESEPNEAQYLEYGEGPNAAPLLDDGRLYTIGFAGVMHCLDTATGAVLWSHDLWREFGGNVVEVGYSSTPVVYRDTVIVLVGGKGHGAVAFDRTDGHVVWENLDFETSYATPAIMKLGGDDQLVAFMTTEVVGADPDNGDLLWRYAIRNSYPQNIFNPIQLGDDLVFVSTLEAGSRGLRPVRGDGFRVEEVWSTRRLQCFYARYAHVGDYLYGSSGDQSVPLMSAIDVRSGELAWRVRGFALSHVIGVGSRLILLDDEGKLTLATPGPDGLTVHSEARILTAPALTPPTVVGSVLYARDQREIVALQLGPS